MTAARVGGPALGCAPAVTPRCQQWMALDMTSDVNSGLADLGALGVYRGSGKIKIKNQGAFLGSLPSVAVVTASVPRDGVHEGEYAVVVGDEKRVNHA